MHISYANTSQNVYSYDDENLTSHETPALIFDYNKALVLYSEAMLKHMLSVVYQNDDVDFESNEKTFIMLDPYITTLSLTHTHVFSHISTVS